jgi:hypothetical protein
MWNCRNETILGTVDSAAITGPHSVSLLLSRAGYEKIFDRAEILFQQPTINAADAEAEAEQQQQPQSNPDSSAPASAAAGGGPMRRMLALPPSTGSLPFDFPESVTAEPEATRSRVVPESRQRSPARSRDREFRNLEINTANSELLTEIILPSGLVTPSSTITLRVQPSRTVKNNRWRVSLRRYNPADVLGDQANDYNGVDLYANGYAVGDWISFGIQLNWWADENIQPSLWGYFFLVEVRWEWGHTHSHRECDQLTACRIALGCRCWSSPSILAERRCVNMRISLILT